MQLVAFAGSVRRLRTIRAENVMSEFPTRLVNFNATLADTLRTRFGLRSPVADPVLHLLANPGKGLRPELAYAVADACGHPDEPRIFAVAAAAELLHLAALVHDDLVDEASLRRGTESLHIRFDAKTAVLVGDYMVGAAYGLLAADVSEATLRRVGPAMRVLAEAELLEFRSRGAEPDLALAQQISVGKAGSLFAWVATAAAIECREWAGENAWQAWGLQLGLLYQLADDLGDHLNIREGKDTGRDAATETPTLLRALLRLDPEGRRVVQEVTELARIVRRPPATGRRLEAFVEFVAGRAETRARMLRA